MESEYRETGYRARLRPMRMTLKMERMMVGRETPDLGKDWTGVGVTVGPWAR